MGLKYMCNACGTLYDSRVDAALCHPDIVLVYENAAEQSFAPDPETGGAKSDDESTPAVSGR